MASRDALEAAQTRLLQTLLEGAPPPDGFDPERLAATRKALARKQAHQAGKLWRRPSLGRRLALRIRRLLRR